MSIPNMSRRDVLSIGAVAAINVANPFMPAQAASDVDSVLSIGLYQTPRSLNGAVQSGQATAMISAQLFSSLVQFDENWTAIPYLASFWEWSNNKKEIKFKIRSDAYFHDGHKITAHDVEYSLNIIKKNHPFKSMLATLSSIDVRDDANLIIKFSDPTPYFLIAMCPALGPILPKHIYDTDIDIKQHPRNIKDVVGSGPFVLQEFRSNESITLKRFDNFFGKNKAYVDALYYSINQSQLSLYMELEKKSLQMLPFMSFPAVLNMAKKNKIAKILDKGYEGAGAICWLDINTRKKPLNNKKVRQALAYAIDRRFILEKLLNGFAKKAVGPIISSSPYAVDHNVYDYDLDKANSLLDEAGFPIQKDGARFNLTIDELPGLAALNSVAEYIGQALKKLNINITMRNSADVPSWAERISAGKYDITVDRVYNWGDPAIGVARTYMSDNIRPIIWTNNTGYANKEVDDLLERAAVASDVDDRKMLYKKFQKIILDECPIIYLYEAPFHTLVSPDVGNPPTSIWGPMSPLDKMHMSENMS